MHDHPSPQAALPLDDFHRQMINVGVSEMRARADVFDAADIDFVHRHVFYLGIKQKSRKEVLFEDLCQAYDLAGNEALVAESGGARRAFSRLAILDLVAWVYRHNRNEVRIYRSEEAGGTRACVLKVPAAVYQDDQG